jgi:hypothetical protein
MENVANPTVMLILGYTSFRRAVSRCSRQSFDKQL